MTRRGGTDVRFSRVPFADVRTVLHDHLASLPVTVESYMEERVLDANHYRITVDGRAAGVGAIWDGTTITQFVLDDGFKAAGQLAFWHLRRLERVQWALVLSCDGYFLSHALDDHADISIQAYVFTVEPPAGATEDRTDLAVRPASPVDVEAIRTWSGDFFPDIDHLVRTGQLFVTQRGDATVGFGIVEASRLFDGVASVGMFTLDHERSRGVGSATIGLLLARCREAGIRAVAGCGRDNHFSKAALEQAGMYSPTRLLRVRY
jgi:GNAT superfamily N-acetyltransferase